MQARTDPLTIPQRIDLIASLRAVLRHQSDRALMDWSARAGLDVAAILAGPGQDEVCQ